MPAITLMAAMVTTFLVRTHDALLFATATDRQTQASFPGAKPCYRNSETAAKQMLAELCQ